MFREFSLPGVLSIITISGVIMYYVSRYIQDNKLGANLKASIHDIVSQAPYWAVLVFMAIPQQIILSQVALRWEPPFFERIFISAFMVTIGMTWKTGPNSSFENDMIRILGTAWFAGRVVQMRPASIPWLIAIDSITTLFVRAFT